MIVSKEQLKDFAAQENALFWDEAMINKAVTDTIPIYTSARPNPKSGKWDCNITRREKEHFRHLMKVKLMAARTDEERQKVIDHYKQLFSE